MEGLQGEARQRNLKEAAAKEEDPIYGFIANMDAMNKQVGVRTCEKCGWVGSGLFHAHVHPYFSLHAPPSMPRFMHLPPCTSLHAHIPMHTSPMRLPPCTSLHAHGLRCAPPSRQWAGRWTRAPRCLRRRTGRESLWPVGCCPLPPGAAPSGSWERWEGRRRRRQAGRKRARLGWGPLRGRRGQRRRLLRRWCRSRRSWTRGSGQRRCGIRLLPADPGTGMRREP